MKLVQLTDLHLPRPGTLLYGLDPHARLEACLAEIAEHHADADLLVVTGDLTESGYQDTYPLLAERLSAVKTPVRLLLGNEDDREAFARTFGGLREALSRIISTSPSGA